MIPLVGLRASFDPAPLSSDLGGMSGMRYHPVMSQCGTLSCVIVSALVLLRDRAQPMAATPPPPVPSRPATERQQTTHKNKGGAGPADWKGKVVPAREISRCRFIIELK